MAKTNNYEGLRKAKAQDLTVGRKVWWRPKANRKSGMWLKVKDAHQLNYILLEQVDDRIPDSPYVAILGEIYVPKDRVVFRTITRESKHCRPGQVVGFLVDEQLKFLGTECVLGYISDHHGAWIDNGRWMPYRKVIETSRKSNKTEYQPLLEYLTQQGMDLRIKSRK